jgi:hypothetical protein
VAVSVFEEIYRLYRDEVFVTKTIHSPVLASQLPFFFVLAVENIHKKKEDFMSDSRLVWEHLKWFLQDQACETKQ